MGVNFLLSVTPNCFKVNLFFSVKKTKVKTKQIKKISKSGEEKIQIKLEANSNSKDKSTNNTNSNESNEVALKDKKDEIEGTDELNNARKKRRRSSASIE